MKRGKMLVEYLKELQLFLHINLQSEDLNKLNH